MKARKRILSAVLLSVAMLVTMLSAASAEKKYSDTLVVDDNNDAEDGLAYDPTTIITKNLIIENGANIPEVSFLFTADVPEQTSETNPKLVCDATEDTLAVIKGINPEAISWTAEGGTSQVVFGIVEYAAQSKSTAAPTEAGNYVTVTDGRAGSVEDAAFYTATKKITLDFSKVGFDEPGIYRYIISEADDEIGEGVAPSVVFDPNVSGDNNCKRTLDVYVIDIAPAEDDETKTPRLAVEGFVLYQGIVTEGPSNDTTATEPAEDEAKLEDGTTKTVTNGKEVEGAKKSVGFENLFISHDLTFSKKVSGNQGSRDKYFAFTLNIKNAIPGTILDVSYVADNDDATKDGDADVSISKNPNAATTVITEDVTQPATLTVDEEGNVKDQVFYLQHGQSIVVRGLPDMVEYTLTEAEEDYDPEITLTGDTMNEKGTFGLDGGDDDVVLLEDKKVNTVTDPTLVEDVTVAFENTRAGVIPTGINLPVVPVVAIAVLFAGFAAVLVVRQKRRED